MTEIEPKISNNNAEELIDITHVHNRDSIRKLFKDNHFKHLLRDSQYDVELKLEIGVNGRRVLVPKKKKSSSPYAINSFIIYTSFLSNAKIKLVKNNKAWEMMDLVDPITKTPFDDDGYQFRKLLKMIEEFHQEFSGDSEEKTKAIRKRIVNYAKSMLTASFNGEPILEPGSVKFDFDDDCCDEVKKKYLKAGEDLYKHADGFKEKTDKFKLFLNRHRLLKSDEEKEEILKRKRAASTAKRQLTANMFNDFD
ncbi:39K [Choristoneura occidentalis granulovirus]|uniref:Uncharacterized protein n=2 Tax=Betabaculovirus chofumiferanae TaxID=3051997 RepID=Q8B582_GVCF|nr:39K [Choristoneura fumiferana granulovirus]AAN77197.1 unknown [Choristoneura fumiferana granulovirus]ABC61176.1 39K [Choristoneura fumiferana granulovirus]